MAQGRNILRAIGGMPLVSFQRSAVRYRLSVTEPGDAAMRVNGAHCVSNDNAFHRPLAANEVSCELRQ